MLSTVVNMKLLLLILMVVVCVVALVLPSVEGLSCLPCDYRKIKCKKPPSNCQPARGPCGCCDVCAGKVGAKCGWLRVPCEKQLVCSPNGRYLTTRLWSGRLRPVPIGHLRGTCQVPRKG